jgi:hypothetical protein
MTFEQRMKRLKKNHEATVRILKLTSLENRRMAAANKKRDKRFAQIMESIDRLVHVAESR